MGDGDDLGDLRDGLAVDRPTLARLCPSAADTTYSMERRPAAIARLAPLGLATSAENSMSSKVASSAASSAASASAGTFDGETNAVASTSRTPVATIGLEQFKLGRQRDRVLDLQAVAHRDLADVDVLG